ncbi:MAG TPA: hypothetical protein VEF72_05120 [Mycobacterium sp.]|nr:hypothetical protein [Mycobacterium sp.]
MSITAPHADDVAEQPAHVRGQLLADLSTAITPLGHTAAHVAALRAVDIEYSLTGATGATFGACPRRSQRRSPSSSPARWRSTRIAAGLKTGRTAGRRQ